MATCKLASRARNTIARRIAAKGIVQDETPDVFEVSYRSDRILATSRNSNVLLLLCAADPTLANLEKVKTDINVETYFITSAQYV